MQYGGGDVAARADREVCPHVLQEGVLTGIPPDTTVPVGRFPPAGGLEARPPGTYVRIDRLRRPPANRCSRAVVIERRSARTDTHHQSDRGGFGKLSLPLRRMLGHDGARLSLGVDTLESAHCASRVRDSRL